MDMITPQHTIIKREKVNIILSFTSPFMDQFCLCDTTKLCYICFLETAVFPGKGKMLKVLNLTHWGRKKETRVSNIQFSKYCIYRNICHQRFTIFHLYIPDATIERTITYFLLQEEKQYIPLPRHASYPERLGNVFGNVF